MSAYVDPIRECRPSTRWPYESRCHLFADTLAELWELAGRLGLGPGCTHLVRDFVHVDLTAHKRDQAVTMGAVEVTAQEAVAFRRRNEAKRKARKSLTRHDTQTPERNP